MEKPENGFVLVSQLIGERIEKFRAKETLDSLNQHKLSRLFMNLIKGLHELLTKGVEIKYIASEAVLANMETGDVKILLTKSTALIESPLSLLDSFSMMHPSYETLRYLAPEILERLPASQSTLSWSIGIMM